MRYNRLKTERIVAMIKGLEAPTEAELVEAETGKDNAKFAVMVHQKKHGC